MLCTKGETLNINDWLARAGFKQTDIIKMQPELIRGLNKQWRIYRENVQTFMEETGCCDPSQFQINHPYRTPQLLEVGENSSSKSQLHL